MGATWNCEVCGEAILGSFCPNEDDDYHKEHKLKLLKDRVTELEELLTKERAKTLKRVANWDRRILTQKEVHDDTDPLE